MTINEILFRKIVAIEPIRLPAEHLDRIAAMAFSAEFYDDIPAGNEEIIRRIGDADAVLLSHTSAIDAQVLDACPDLCYIGMCCSLYSPESANVDILHAQDLGITVTGVRDYGDEGVPEYVVSELVRILHGFGDVMFAEEPLELTGLPVGVLGMGATGTMVARALHFFGADVHYYSRTRKPELEQAFGYRFLPLEELLPRVDVLCTCLNKNVILLGEREFQLFGEHKILINTSIGPSHDVAALKNWLSYPRNYMFCDNASGIDPSGELLSLAGVFCAGKSSGMTTLAARRLGDKVISNLQVFLREGPPFRRPPGN